MQQIKDVGGRVLSFDGNLLGKSSSWRPGSDRWVEFELYKTKSGTYVLGRTGHSLLFHDPKCPVVKRNGLKASPVSELDDDALPCEECNPSTRLVEVCSEKPRHWALVSDTAEAIYESLQRYDKAGARYLTKVAEDLLVSASKVDEEVSDAYYNEIID
jgi:hypothetical protein